VHAGALEPGTDGDFASRLDNAGGSTQTLRMKVGITYPFAIVPKVFGALACFIVLECSLVECMQKGLDAALVEFVIALLNPLPALFTVGAVDYLANIAEVLFGVKAIQDLDGLRKQFAGGVPEFQIQAEPSPGTAQRGASVKPRRVASRNTRSAKSDRVMLVSGTAALSMAAE